MLAGFLGVSQALRRRAEAKREAAMEVSGDYHGAPLDNLAERVPWEWAGTHTTQPPRSTIMGKNAYEIRLEALHLSFSILSQQYHGEVDQWRKAQDDSPDEGGLPSFPEAVATDGVLSEAAKLYAFIEKGGKDVHRGGF